MTFDNEMRLICTPRELYNLAVVDHFLISRQFIPSGLDCKV